MTDTRRETHCGDGGRGRPKNLTCIRISNMVHSAAMHFKQTFFEWLWMAFMQQPEASFSSRANICLAIIMHCI